MTPEFTPGQRVRCVDPGFPPGIIAGRSHHGLNGSWRYSVECDDGTEYSAAGYFLEPDIARLPFRLRVVAGTDCVEPDLLPSEINP